MDWIQKWKQSHRNMPYHDDILRDYENSLWAALAPYYDELHCAEFSQAASRKLDSYLQGVSSILEIGAGTGALTLELARKVGRLTALDASPDMLRILKQKLEKRAVNNVHPVLSPWEDAEVERHDLVLASGCTYGFHEIDRAVEKMVLSAAKAIAFTGETNRREPVGLSSLRNLFQRDLQGGRDEPVLYNILCQMGLHPDVHMLRNIRQTIRFPNIAQAVERLKLILGLPVGRVLELAAALSPFLNCETGEIFLGEGSFDGVVMICPVG